LRRTENLLHLRSRLIMDSAEFPSFFDLGHRRVFFDRLQFWAFFLKDGKELALLLRRQLKLFGQSFQLRHGVPILSQDVWGEGYEGADAQHYGKERSNFRFHARVFRRPENKVKQFNPLPDILRSCSPES